MKCSTIGCDITLELEISMFVKICRWCRQEAEPNWDDTDWMDDYDQFHNTYED